MIPKTQEERLNLFNWTLTATSEIASYRQWLQEARRRITYKVIITEWPECMRIILNSLVTLVFESGQILRGLLFQMRRTEDHRPLHNLLQVHFHWLYTNWIRQHLKCPIHSLISMIHLQGWFGTRSGILRQPGPREESGPSGFERFLEQKGEQTCTDYRWMFYAMQIIHDDQSIFQDRETESRPQKRVAEFVKQVQRNHTRESFNDNNEVWETRFSNIFLTESC